MDTFTEITLHGSIRLSLIKPRPDSLVDAAHTLMPTLQACMVVMSKTYCNNSGITHRASSTRSSEFVVEFCLENINFSWLTSYLGAIRARIFASQVFSVDISQFKKVYSWQSNFVLLAFVWSAQSVPVAPSFLINIFGQQRRLTVDRETAANKITWSVSCGINNLSY